MFAKPYKHKSVNTLKNSEKKQLVRRIQEEFGVGEDVVKELVPAKSSCVWMRVELSSGRAVSVLAVDARPLLVDAAGLLPTVCALWRAPHLLPSITIHTPVFKKVQGGAPLYLPGVVIPAGGAGFPQFPAGALLAVATEDNSAACLLGRACMSSADMLLRTQGVCVEPLQVHGDQLCKDDKFARIERPSVSPAAAPAARLATHMQQLSLQTSPSQEEWPALGRPPPPAPNTPPPAPQVPPPAPNEPRLIAEPPEHAAVDPADSDDIDTSVTEPTAEVPEEPDELLRWCLLSFIKLHARSVTLPLHTNLLYKKYLQALCPAGRSLDVKKTSYKKLSKFLEAMQQEGLVEVREVERGVAAVVALSAAHPLLRAHKVPESVKQAVAAAAAGAGAEPEYRPPRVREMYCVTAHVSDIFAPLRKGSALTASEARAALTQYVRARGLAAPLGRVTLDAALAKLLDMQPQETAGWEAVTRAVLARMTPATELQHEDGSVSLTKSRLQPIAMTVATRSGNKKVTLVSHLEQFGLRPGALARAWQARAAATCTVTRAPGAAADQLLLQGDQTHFVAKMLIETYGLPKKFVEGADKALKKKK